MHPETEEKSFEVYADGVKIGAVSLPELTICPDDDQPEGWEPLILPTDPMTVTVKVRKDAFCAGGRKRFIKLCMGILGMDRNSATYLADCVGRINRERNQLPYSVVYRRLLWKGALWGLFQDENGGVQE